MYVTELLAMISVFGSLTIMGCTVVAATGLVLRDGIRKYFEVREKELELRRWEAEHRLEQARLSATIPAWVDRDDPTAVAAWNRAVAETWQVSARAALRLES